MFCDEFAQNNVSIIVQRGVHRGTLALFTEGEEEEGLRRKFQRLVVRIYRAVILSFLAKLTNLGRRSNVVDYEIGG